jgi:hypothetical protein
LYDECGVWKRIFNNWNSTVIDECWKYYSPEIIHNLLKNELEKMWEVP